MDKYEYKRLVEQIQSLIDQGEYAQAAEIADKIDWRRVRSVMTLGTISDLYKINGRYEDARDIMLLAYDRKPESRQICYSLCELYIKTGEPVAAAEFYKEFEKIAPKDPGRYVLKYKLYDAYDVSLDEKIEVLEKLKKEEYQERWMYELASLYHRRGLGTKCVEVCDEIILWFGTGKYVNMAMELKMLHEPLTPEQQKKYDARNQKQDVAAREAVIPQAPTEQDRTVAPEVADQRTIAYPAVGAGVTAGNTNEWKAEEVEQGGSEKMGETRVFNTEEVRRQLREREKTQDEFDIQVKTVDVSQYNTMNLQAEIAEGLKEILGRQEEEGKDQKPEGYEDSITRVIPPVVTSDSGPLDMPVMEDADEEDLEATEETNKEPEKEPIHAISGEMYQDENGYFHDASEVLPKKDKNAQEENVLEREALTAQPPESIAKVLTQEADGQLKFVMPESKSIEKQITGQISIDDVRAEWERMKLESQAKQEEEVRQQVLRHTGKMFTEFEEAMRDNILKQMEDTIDPASFAEPKFDEDSESDDQTEMGSEWNFEGIGGMTDSRNPEKEEKAEETSEAEPEKTEEAKKLEETEVTVEEEPEKAEETEVKAEAEPEKAEETEVKTEAEPEKTEETEVTVEEEPEKAEETEVKTEAEPEKAEETEVKTEAEPEKTEETEKAEEAEVLAEAAVATAIKEVTEKKTLGDVLRDDYTWGEEAIEEEEFEEASKRRNMFSRRDEEPETVSAADGSGIDFESLPQEESEEPQEEESFVKRFSMDDPDEEFARINDDDDADDVTEQEDTKENENNYTPEIKEASEEPVIAARALSAEEEKLFDPWIRDDSDKEQLARAIDTVSMAAYTGNVVITGELGLNTVGLAKKMIYVIKNGDSNFSGKVAKVTGGALVKTDVAQLMDGLKNGALIVEDAAAMPDKAVQDLHKCLQRENWGIVVFLLDTKKCIKKFFKSHEELRSAFNVRVNVQPMSNDALAEFAKQYAREKEFSIDNLGTLALHMKIDEMQTARHAVNTEDVKEVMDDAIESASRKTFGHFIDILLGRRYDDEDMIIITEKDFE